jgi:isocitrate dehydrogenase kinase/phosphatase
MQLSKRLANLILKGFTVHYTSFQTLTSQAQIYFAAAKWQEIQRISSERISFYDNRVNECIEQLKKHIDDSEINTELWLDIKGYYTELLSFHPQADLAETFFNSVFCRLFHRKYFNNDFIFVNSTQMAPSVPMEEEYKSFFPIVEGLKPTIKEIVAQFDFQTPFIDLDRDIKHILKAFITQVPNINHSIHLMRFDILKAAFYRNKAAYIVGRIVSKQGVQPFIIPILHKKDRGLFIDAVLTDSTQMRVVFGFARAYFMVNTRSPSGIVNFLNQLMPNRTPAELYNAIGFHKHGKSEFYREFLNHLAHSNESFEVAAGTPGMVMEVFTHPTFPFVFKVIRDKFGDGKPFGKRTVLARYQLVKKHDKVGRMADTIEFSNVAFPVSRFPEKLLERLKKSIGQSLEFDNDLLIIKHLYIERRMTPLNLFLKDATDDDKRHVMAEYGQALKEMIAVNIFPGDMLLKNFGVTKHKRVIFYDYDEVQYLTEMNFRDMPKSDHGLDYPETYSIAPQDVFIEQLTTFVTTDPYIKQLLIADHPELNKPEFWRIQQQKIIDGIMTDIYPYPESLRFATKY